MPLSQTRWIDLPHVADDRGVLTSIESGLDIPFAPRRVFFIRGGAGERGSHAHRATSQLLVCIAGTLQVEFSDGSASVTHTLSDPDRGLYVPPMIWIRMYDFAPGAVLLVLADTHYADATYVRDWDEFLALSQRERPV
jgi:hypothetical protein